MKKTNTNEEYEQLTMDFGDEIPAVETVEEEPKPAYARKAYVKRINSDSNTVLTESEPNVKEYGLLFMTDVALA